MRQVLLLLFVAGTCIAAQPSDDAVKKELKLFHGKWACVGGQGMDGKPVAEDEIKRTSMVVEGNKFSIKQNDNVIIEGTFTVDPTKKIKTIDVDLKKPGEGKVLGIYQIDGDMRKSCFATNDAKGRPDGFRKEAGYLILEWKRAK